MYILTIPSFTWIGPIPQSGSSIPSARAGHTCNMRDGQMVLVGGFNTTVTTCDSPGIYIFNASSLEWTSSFTALSPSPDHDPGNSVLAASYGYTVPDPVVSVIGGSPTGSATVTTPAASATGGPFATGTSPVFTVTASGSAATSTVTSPASASAAKTARQSQAGLIAAIVVAVLAALAAGYLGYCAWLYRRQVRAYKTHLAAQNRFPARSASHGSSFVVGMLAGLGGRRSKKERYAALEREKEEARESSSAAGESFAWVGQNRPASKVPPPPRSVGGTTAGGSSSRPSPYGDDTSAGRPSTSGSTDGLLEGQEPSYFAVVLGPRRALRVVNGLEDGEGGPARTAPGAEEY